jgi:GNAT superfamily N-acetyltransferase
VNYKRIAPNTGYILSRLGLQMDTEHFEFRYNSATGAVAVRGKKGTVLRIYAKTRGQGDATALLRKITRWADENDLELHLSVRSYGHPVQTILSNEQLVTFYAKFGFVNQHPGQYLNTKMIRIKNTPYDEREDFS